jgi:hypothetical protein
VGDEAPEVRHPPGFKEWIDRLPRGPVDADQKHADAVERLRGSGGEERQRGQGDASPGGDAARDRALDEARRDRDGASRRGGHEPDREGVGRLPRQDRPEEREQARDDQTDPTRGETEPQDEDGRHPEEDDERGDRVVDGAGDGEANGEKGRAP